MEPILALKEIYQHYTAQVAQVYAGAKPMDGLFGWGDDPRRDPCHMRFYEDAEKWVRAFIEAGAEQETVFAAVDFMLREPANHREQASFWFLYAAQGLTRPLIPRLTPGQCAYLRDFYDDAYPRRDRMPVQKELYRALKKQAKA